MPLRTRLRALLLLVLCLWPARALAQTPPDWLGLYAIARLAPNEVERLRRVFNNTDPDKLSSHPDIVSIQRRLARIPGWDAANFAELVASTPTFEETAGKKLSREDQRLVEWLTLLRTELARPKPKPACSALGDELRQSWHFLRGALFSKLAGECVRWPGSEAPPSFQVVLTHPDSTRLLSVTTERVLDLRKEDALDLGDMLAFFVPVSEESPITLRAYAGERSATQALTLRQSRPPVFLFEEKDSVCVDLELALDRGDRVAAFLAGTQLFEGQNLLYLPSDKLLAAPAQLKVLSNIAQRPKAVEERDLAWSAIKEATEKRGCFEVRLDLTHQASDQAVAIVSTRVSPNCASNGVDEGELQSRAEQALRRVGWPSRPARQWATLVSDFSKLMNELDKGREVGAPRGLLDPSVRFEQGASEARRQGFGELLSIEIGCSPGVPTRQMTVRATVLDLKGLKPEKNQLLGLDLGKAQRSRVDVVPGAEYLDSGLTATLSQLHDRRPYLRIEPGNGAWRFATGARVSVRTYLPSSERTEGASSRAKKRGERQVRLGMRRLLDDERYLCAAAANRTSVVDEWWNHRGAFTGEETQTVSASVGIEVSGTLGVAPRKPGAQLVRIELLDPKGEPYEFGEGDSPVVAYGCVWLVEPRLTLSLGLGYAKGTSLTPAPDARRDDLGYGYLLGAVLFQEPTRTGLMVGAGLGYANAVHSLEAPPSWEFGTDNYDAKGGLVTNWTRQSILFGPVLAFRVRALPCVIEQVGCSDFSRRFGLLFRAAPVLDVGKIQTENVDPGLTRFMDRSSGLDLDLTALVQAGLEINLSSTTSLYGLFDVGFVGWDDLVLGGRDQRRARSGITYDAHTVIGASVGVMTSP